MQNVVGELKWRTVRYRVLFSNGLTALPLTVRLRGATAFPGQVIGMPALNLARSWPIGPARDFWECVQFSDLETVADFPFRIIRGNMLLLF